MDSTFLERLIEEEKELQAKINLLSDFILNDFFNKMSEIQQSLLVVQLKAMETYQKCLVQRIRHINEHGTSLK